MTTTTSLLPDIKLRFNIEHPSFEECYAYGYACAEAGIAEDANPYRASSKASEQWIEGWWAGFYGEEPLYALTTDGDEETLFHDAANDATYIEHRSMTDFWVKVLEVTGMVAVSAMVSYQLIDLLAA